MAFTELSPTDVDTGLLHVVVETPAGSRNKFFLNEKTGHFELKKVLPVGMSFPCDFGFVPQTLGGDGDAIDALVLSDAATYPGVVIPSRLVGVIEAEQTVEGKTSRNDRLVAIADVSHAYADIHETSQLPERWLRELRQFFVNYMEMEGKTYRLLGVGDARRAAELLDEAIRAFR